MVAIYGFVRWLRFALVVLALSACGQSGSGLIPAGSSIGVNALADKIKLQYISNHRGDTLLQFDYPKETSSIATINGVTKPLGECTNALYGSGEKVFWVSGSDGVYKFKVGTYPSGKLSDSYEVLSCAIDPKSGDLADIDKGGFVNVYTRAQGTPKSYSTGFNPFFCGYDDKGNLFVDGTLGSSIVLGELPKGGDSFKQITIPQLNGNPGAVQYDGTYLTVSDTTTIHRFEITGSVATEKGKVALDACQACWQTWIGKGVVFAPDLTGNTAYVFKYPEGGKPIAQLTGTFVAPFGSVQVTP